MYAKICQVSAVNAGRKTIDAKPVDNTAEIFDIPLQADSAGGGIVLYPKTGSMIALVFTSKTTAIAIGYSEIERIGIKGDKLNAVINLVEGTIELDAEHIAMNGGGNGGLCITPELSAQLGKMTARIDGIIDAINNGVTVPQDGGAALQTSIKAGLAAIVDKEDFANIENDKITH